MLLATYGAEARILAGGTDLINWMADKIYKPAYVIDLRLVPDLNRIVYGPGRGLTLGAATTIEAIERSPVIRERYPALAYAAAQIGSPQIRAMATVGGNCCNASPCADMPPPLVVLGAHVVLVSRQGRRDLLLEDFIQGNRQTAIRPDEFLESIQVPEPWPHSACRFAAFGLRAAQEIDLASVAANVAIDPATRQVTHARLAMGSVAPVPMRAREAESLLLGQHLTASVIDAAAERCGQECRPIDDLRASAAYRRHVITVLARQTLNEACAALV